MIQSITPTDRGHQVGVIIVTTGFITIIIKAVMGLMLAPDWNVSHSCISGVGHHHHVSASANQNDSLGYLLALIQSRPSLCFDVSICVFCYRYKCPFSESSCLLNTGCCCKFIWLRSGDLLMKIFFCFFFIYTIVFTILVSWKQ